MLLKNYDYLVKEKSLVKNGNIIELSSSKSNTPKNKMVTKIGQNL